MSRSCQVPVYMVLLHYPMVNRHGEIVTTAVTNLDIHDIARSSRTYGLKAYYIVTPIEEQHALVSRILKHWQSEQSRQSHPDRAEALSLVRLVRTFDEVKTQIRDEAGEFPEVVLTDAQAISPEVGETLKYEQYGRLLRDPKRTKPALIAFGTGWGIAPIFYPEVHRVLEPIYGASPGLSPSQSQKQDYNHLSVRSAVAIILDRILDRTHD